MKIEGVVYRPLKAARRLRAPHSLVSRHGKTSSVVWNFLKFARRVFRVSDTCRIRAARGTRDLMVVVGSIATGKVAKVEPITTGNDFAAVQSQSAAMASAKISLKEAVDKAIGEAAGARAVGVIPNLKEGRPVASVLFLKGERFTIVQQPLD